MESWAGLPSETPITISPEGFLPLFTTLGGMQKGIKDIVDKAVQAVIAQKEGELAAANVTINQWQATTVFVGVVAAVIGWAAHDILDKTDP